MSPGGRGATPAAALFAILLLLSIGAFAIERAARSSDDLVNTVVLTPMIAPGETAEVTFTLSKPDNDVDVRIIDGNLNGDGAVVRTLASGEDLAAGPHTYSWNGRDDSGAQAPVGLYALQVILGEQGRDVKPPGRIEITGTAP